MDPVVALQRIGYLLERRPVPLYRSRAFRRAAERIRELGEAEVRRRIADGTLLETPDIGVTTGEVVIEALDGRVPTYLAKLEAESAASEDSPTAVLRKQLKGDCHVHTDWSDGRSPIEVMIDSARALGHDYVVITDHSPRLTIARGLSRERLLEQMRRIDELNEHLAPFRVLTGIEVDILEDGALDQDPEILARLDLVVASVHSKLRMPREPMTARMVAAIRNPNMDVLGHATGRIIVGRGRPESEFDAERVFAACAEHDKAIEINSRPERLDPPRRLLREAQRIGCRFSINTDAHAPGQLEWLENGCSRAVECDIDAEHVVNTWSLDALRAWT
ncbi:MAG TPA: PHP domain-containing protein, partial [Polyangiaceae bacterium]